MKVELKEARVELEVGEGKSHIVVNGERLPIPREVGIRLVFGETTPLLPPGPSKTPPEVVSEPKPGLAKGKRKGGCQSPASREKLSKSLRKFYANQRKEKGEPAKKQKKYVGKHLNGASSVHMN